MTVVQVLWKRAKEPTEQADSSISNIDFFLGMPSLVGDASTALQASPNASGQHISDVLITTADGAILPSFKVLLAASSPAVSAMFSHQLKVLIYMRKYCTCRLLESVGDDVGVSCATMPLYAVVWHRLCTIVHRSFGHRATLASRVLELVTY